MTKNQMTEENEMVKENQMAEESQTSQENKPTVTYKIKRKITLPLLKTTIDVPINFVIDENIYIGKKVQNDRDAAILANITDLDSGESMLLIIPAVLQGVLHDEFGAAFYGLNEEKESVELKPEDPEGNTYVGKGFQIIKHKKPSGKQYNPYSVSLLDLG